MTNKLFTIYKPGGIVKAVSPTRIEGHLVRYAAGPAAEDTDLDNEWFSAKTWFMRDAGYPIKGAPLNYQHGMLPEFGPMGIGIFDMVDEDEIGLFVEAQLNTRERYMDMLKELGRKREIKIGDAQLRRKADLAYKAVETLVTSVPLQQSMGADPSTYSVDPDTRHIDSAGIIHGALTPTPADDRNPLVTIKGMWGEAFNLENERLISIPTAKPAGVTNRKGASADNVERGDGQTQPVNLKSTRKETNMDWMEKLQAMLADMQSLIGEALSGMEMDDAMAAEMTEEIMDEAKAEVEEMMDEEEVDAKSIDPKELDKLLEEKLAAAVQKSLSKVVNDSMVTRERRQKLFNDAVAAGKSAVEPQSKVGGYRSPDSIKNKNIGQLTDARKMPLVDRIKSKVEGDFKAYKTLNPYQGTNGGFLLGQELAPTILDPLRASVVMFGMGVKQTTVAGTGSYVIPKMTTAPTTFRPGINTAITDGPPTYDMITAFMRPLGAVVDIPRQLLATSPLQVEQQIRDQLEKSLRLQIDKEILIGEGTVVSGETGAQIKGVLRTLEQDSTLSSTNIKTLATNGKQPGYTDLVAAETQVATGNVETDENTGFVVHPRTRGTFRSLTTTTGEPLFYPTWGDSSAYSDLIGYRTAITTQIPINVTTGTSTDTSYIFYGNWGYGEYVMSNDIEFIVDEVSVANKLVIRITAYTFSDFIVHYPEAFYVIKGVRA